MCASHSIGLVDRVHFGSAIGLTRLQVRLLSIWLGLRARILCVLFKLLLLLAVWSALCTQVSHALSCAMGWHRAECLVIHACTIRLASSAGIANVDDLGVGHRRAARAASYRDSRVAACCHSGIVLANVFACGLV